MKRLALTLFSLCLALSLVACSAVNSPVASPVSPGSSLRILMSDDLRDLEPLILSYAQGKFQVSIAYEGISDVKSLLERETLDYDAVWLSSTVWLEMKEGGQRVTNAKITCINPVVFAVSMDKARALGFVGRQALSVSDILAPVKDGALSFVLPSVTQTNSGMFIYLGLLSTLSGNPELLTLEDIQDAGLREELTALFRRVERSSGSDDFVADLALGGKYDCIVSTESNCIALNNQLAARGREPFYLIYPVDGVSLADAPLAYIDHSDPQKKEMFLSLQAYVLSAEGQDQLARLGRRTGFGGTILEAYREVFREDWGIRPDAYLAAVKTPSKSIIQAALMMYQSELRKPSRTVFCLDFSGSMGGIGGNSGNAQLLRALDYILDPAQASRDYIQFTGEDIVSAYAFTSVVSESYGAFSGDETARLLNAIRRSIPGGGTNIYVPVMRALEELSSYDPAEYTLSVVLMTDGDSYNDMDRLESFCQSSGADIPVYSILFGTAVPEQLEAIAALTGGKVFDGRYTGAGMDALTKAFRTIRGYN